VLRRPFTSRTREVGRRRLLAVVNRFVLVTENPDRREVVVSAGTPVLSGSGRQDPAAR
jgi:hypothetical protein